MIRTILIGVTGYAALYFEKLLEFHEEGKVLVKAVTVRNQDEAGAASEKLNAKGIPIYNDAMKMIREEGATADFCCIPTGPDTHFQFTMAAIEQCCHVLVEKPVAGTLKQYNEMQKYAAEKGVSVIAGFQDIYCECNQNLKRRILSGEFGIIREIRLIGLWPRNLAYYRRNEWAGKMQLNGEMILDSPANNAFSHFINLALFFAGDSMEKSADIAAVKGELLRCMPIETFDTAIVSWKTGSGIPISAWITHACKETIQPVIDIYCEKAQIQWTMENIRLLRGTDVVEEMKSANPVEARNEMFTSVIGYLSGKDAPICSLEIARRQTEAIDALHQLCEVKDLSEPQFDKIQLKDGNIQYSIRGIEQRMRIEFGAEGQ